MQISVIIPTYNRADLLPRTLASIQAQTLSPAEIIVVDDGSTDSTPALLARLGPAIRALRVPNGGDLVARNAGLRAAGGDLVAFCDSDDLWRPEFLAEMVRFRQAEPGLHAAYGDFVIVRDDIWEQTGKFAAAPPGFWTGLRPAGPGRGVFDHPVFPRLLEFQPFFTSCLVADRRWLLSVGGWDCSVGRLLAGDFATALRLAEHAPLGILQAPLVGIRKHAHNISGNDRATALGEALVLERVLQTHPAAAAHAEAIRASIALRRAQALASAFADQDHRAVHDIFHLLPPERRRGRTWLKHAVATLPPGPRAILARTLLAAGSAKARW
ncbi:MAG: glycosyltransferase family 2 protein [Acetobacteraceae bacterium]